MTRPTKVNTQQGFTLVELSLAILMVAILAMAILGISLQIMKIYSKGITLKSMNQASRDISDQLTRDVRSSSVTAIDTSQVASNMSDPGASSRGRLCLGSAAYVWNTMSTPAASAIKYSGINGNQPVHLARLAQPGDYCSKPLGTDITSAYVPTELLGNTVNNIALYGFAIKPLVTGESLYQVDFTIGTNDSTVIDTDAVTKQSQCKLPTDNQGNFDFCTVSQFRLLIKASDAGGN